MTGNKINKHFSDGGGGGERVLWWVIRTIQSMDDNAQIVLYTGDDMTNYERKVKVYLSFSRGK